MDVTTVLLIIGTVGLLFAFLLYRRARIRQFDRHSEEWEEEVRRKNQEWEERFRNRSRMPPGWLDDEPRPSQSMPGSVDAGNRPTGEVFGEPERREARQVPREALTPEQGRVLGNRSHQENVRLAMQVLITFVGLAFGVMFLFDGCYAWLGWCQEPASDEAKNWASGIVGTVVGFWLTKA